LWELGEWAEVGFLVGVVVAVFRVQEAVRLKAAGYRSGKVEGSWASCSEGTLSTGIESLTCALSGPGQTHLICRKKIYKEFEEFKIVQN